MPQAPASFKRTVWPEFKSLPKDLERLKQALASLPTVPQNETRLKYIATP